jgi:hypothetical protein
MHLAVLAGTGVSMDLAAHISSNTDTADVTWPFYELDHFRSQPSIGCAIAGLKDRPREALNRIAECVNRDVGQWTGEKFWGKERPALAKMKGSGKFFDRSTADQFKIGIWHAANCIEHGLQNARRGKSLQDWALVGFVGRLCNKHFVEMISYNYDMSPYHLLSQIVGERNVQVVQGAGFANRPFMSKEVLRITHIHGNIGFAGMLRRPVGRIESDILIIGVRNSASWSPRILPREEVWIPADVVPPGCGVAVSVNEANHSALGLARSTVRCCDAIISLGLSFSGLDLDEICDMLPKDMRHKTFYQYAENENEQLSSAIRDRGGRFVHCQLGLEGQRRILCELKAT